MNRSVFDLVREALAEVPPETMSKGLLIAVSGGADSVALLHLVHELVSPEVRLEVVTVDHRLRAHGAVEVERVCELAGSLGLTCHRRAVSEPDPREEAMRVFRKRIFHELLMERELGAVATGHTMDDQAETLIMRMIRGTGPTGLAGMRRYAAPALKPLLDVSRRSLLEYLSLRRLSFDEDPSNTSLDYFRNRVRHTLLPLMAQENPQILHALSGLALSTAEEHDTLMSLAMVALPAVSPFESGQCWPLDPLRPSGVTSLWLRNLHANQSDGAMLERQHSAAALEFLGTRSHGHLALPGGLSLEVIGDFGYLGPPLLSPLESCTIPSAPAAFSFGRGQGRVLPSADGDVAIPSSAWPVVLRTKRPGDRLERKGMGPVRLKKVLAHLPHRIKERLLVLQDRHGRLLWVEGAGRAYGLEGRPHRLVWDLERFSLPGFS